MREEFHAGLAGSGSKWSSILSIFVVGFHVLSGPADCCIVVLTFIAMIDIEQILRRVDVAI